MALKILSANCQGQGSIEKRLDVFNYLKEKSVIYIVSKTHTQLKHPNVFFRSHECLLSSDTSNSSFNKTVDFKINNSISDPEGNYIICDISVADNRFTLINLYGPNKETPQFFQNIIDIAETIENTNMVICEDFNTIQDEKLDYFNYKHIINKKSHKKILEIKETCILHDPFREAYPSLRRYTWRRKKVQVGKDQEKTQSEKDSHSKNRGGKKQSNNQVHYTIKHIVSRMSSYFPNRWPLSYLNLTKILKHT